MPSNSASSSASSSVPVEEEPLYHIPSRQPKVAPATQAAGKIPAPAQAPHVFPKPTPEELEAFKGQLDEWVRVEEQLRKLAIARRECVLRLKKLGEGVETFMQTFGYEHIHRKDGTKIKYRVREVKQPLTVKTVKVKLMSLTEEEMRALTPPELLQRIFDQESRGTITKTSLRRWVPLMPPQIEV